LEDDFVIVKQADLKTLELNLQKTDPASAAELRKICSASIKELLQSYPEYTFQLAGRLEKNIAPFIIECPDEIKVDPEQYAEFFRSLVHVFRNMVDHGIESPDERIGAGKDMTGKIRCTAAREKDGFQIRIADDGKGIDVESLKRKAVRLGIATAENAAQMSFEQTLQLVFVDGLSLSETQNGISGRGVGLAALRREVERLQGKIEIETAPGQGTAFIFHLPLNI
jgi:two-component system chemotaxis sensor kinase CheA